MNAVKKVGYKLYTAVVPSEYAVPDFCQFYTRKEARNLVKAMGGVVLEVKLTPYQTKQINQMQGVL